MERYAGRTPTDPPLGGGGFPKDEGYCREECNFVPCEDGFVYGHFETVKGTVDRQVRIERLGSGRNDEYIDGIDVVWTAPTRGNDPRTVVGWFKNARVYRHRQKFGKNFPSEKHRRDDISSFRVRARCDDVFLVPVANRHLDLERGPGWSGQASWWYAEDTSDIKAAKFVATIKNIINDGELLPITKNSVNRMPRGNARTGAAAEIPYQRYVSEYEATIHPRHDQLQKRFVSFLIAKHRNIQFMDCIRDDLKYNVVGRPGVMVEVKPTDEKNLRFAIRTAIGQLLDYRQEQGWKSLQLIVVETEVKRAADLQLAFDNGFGLAWPLKDGFDVIWPDGKRGS